MNKCGGTLGWVAAIILLAVAWPREAQALGLGPALFKIQNIAPGKTLDLKKQCNFNFYVPNNSDNEQFVNLSCGKPSQCGLVTWEKGYEEVPDAAWFHLEKEELAVPAHTKAEFGLTIDVPDKPENYNRKWVLAVRMCLGQKKNTGAFGVGLAVAVRVQLETLPRADAENALGAPLATAPSALDIEGAPGECFSGTVLLRNNLATELRCTPERLVQVYVPDPERKYDPYDRYVSEGCKALLKESWLTLKYEPFTLQAGKDKRFKISGQIPASAKPGERWEELVFIRGDVEKAEDKDNRPLRTFVRVRLTIKAQNEKMVAPKE